MTILTTKAAIKLGLFGRGNIRMHTPQGKIQKQILEEKNPMHFYGFGLIINKMMSQLSRDIKKIQGGEIVQMALINNIEEAKLAIDKMNYLYVPNGTGESFRTTMFKKAVRIYNNQRPPELKIHEIDYKKFVNDLAGYQLNKLWVYFNPRKYKNLEMDEKRHQQFTFFCDCEIENLNERTQEILHAKNVDDKDICILQENIQAIDSFLTIIGHETYDCTRTIFRKNHAQEFSGHPLFEKYLISLYRQYHIDSAYYPDFMGDHNKVHSLVVELGGLRCHMVRYKYHRNMDDVNSIIKPLLRQMDEDDLIPSSKLNSALQQYIDELFAIQANSYGVKKNIAIDTLEFLITFYAQISGHEYFPAGYETKTGSF